MPSLATLLDSSKRPTYWKRLTTDGSQFDPIEVGWAYRAEEQGRAQGAGPEVYDTTRMGYLNTGHTYGDGLTEQQRLDLIEYLKTL